MAGRIFRSVGYIRLEIKSRTETKRQTDIDTACRELEKENI